MKIEKVTIENFKNLKNIDEAIKGKSILLLAENGKGKSSFMQAIQVTLGSSNMPPNPITDGEESGSIEVVTDENGNQYTFRMKMEKGKPPVVEVTAPNGIRDRRKSIIGSIVGEIDFDLHEFVRLSETTTGKKKQVEIIKSFFPEEIKTKLAEIELRIANSFEDRTEINRKAKFIAGALNEFGLSKEDFKTYATTIDISKAQADYEAVGTINSEIAAVEERMKIRKEELTEFDEQIAAIQKKCRENEAKNIEAEEYLKDNKKQDLEPLRQKMETSQDHNLKAQKVQEYKEKSLEKEKLEDEAGEMTVLIETSRQALADATREMDMPIDGLSFNDEALLYNGHEVDINTLSTSEIMHLGIQLKMAKNPNVKVLFIENGESLGTDRLKEIQKLCEKYDYQIIMEQVERGTEELKVEIMPKF